MQGLHNNGAPFGMKKNADKILVPDEAEIAGLQLAFTLYATDQYSDNDIAIILNEYGYKTKRGRPFSKDTVRDMLQNQVYLGKVSYQQCLRTPDGTRTWTAPVQWFDGQHETVIEEELFNRCQEVREKRAHHHLPTVKYNPYLLRDLVYCYDCCCNRPTTPTFRSYGKMRPQAYDKKKYKCYRCLAHELGYQCEQGLVKTAILDKQIFEILQQLSPPAHWRQMITKSIGEMLGEKDVQQRLEDIRAIIKRMDSRWDLGFITDEQEYIQQRINLQEELKNLAPVDTNELERAIDLLDNFITYWERCGDDVEAQSKLLKQILARAYVKGRSIVAITLKPNCHLVLGADRSKSTEYTFDPFL